MPGESDEARRKISVTASIRRISSVSHSLDIEKARTKSEAISKPRNLAASPMPLAVR